jgi:GT2 family glycosyltransferase
MITACAAVRRETYAQVGGMDESLPVACNDLDLCLRIEALGLRNILTPFAELYHHESASRGYHYDTPESRQEAADEARFRQKWGSRLEHDPMYNPNLTRHGLAYSLADAQ